MKPAFTMGIPTNAELMGFFRQPWSSHFIVRAVYIYSEMASSKSEPPLDLLSVKTLPSRLRYFSEKFPDLECFAFYNNTERLSITWGKLYDLAGRHRYFRKTILILRQNFRTSPYDRKHKNTRFCIF